MSLRDRLPSTRQIAVWLVAIVILAVVPQVVQGSYQRYLITLAILYAVLASNWDLTLGYAGIFNFAHVAFFALGAYTTGILTSQYNMSPWLGIAAAMPAAALAAALVYLPVIRLRGIYVALITYVFSQIALEVVLAGESVTGGASGLVFIPPVALGSVTFDQNNGLGYYYLAAALLIVSTLFLRIIVSSHYGFSVIGLRDAENLAVSRGVSLHRQRFLAFVLSAIFTGAAGAVYAHFIGVVSPELFSFGYASLLLSMILLGGIGTIYGPIFGALIMTFVNEPLNQYGAWRVIIVSTLIIVVLWVLPGGVLSFFGPWRREGQRFAGRTTHDLSSRIRAAVRTGFFRLVPARQGDRPRTVMTASSGERTEEES